MGTYDQWKCREDDSNMPRDSRRSIVRHVAFVEADLESFRRGGSTRTAACVCGWHGPQRATLELAVDDALMHEKPDGDLP